jgi:hypothetical protein
MAKYEEKTSLLLQENGLRVRKLKGRYWVIRHRQQPLFKMGFEKEPNWPTAEMAIEAAESYIKAYHEGLTLVPLGLT